MTTDEIEALLDGAEETDRLEFKGAMSWNKNQLVKDILGMANVQDGGRIVFGVKDETFQREGMSNDQIGTFKIDDMRDQIAPYADPRVVFRVHSATDRDGLSYIVIDVAPFDDQPVICKRDGADVQAGVIYFRSQAQKPQSARVSNASDMREIVDRAVVGAMRRQQKLGFTVNAEQQYDYNDELGDL
jgi:predicted HTH transcriptional regulator